MPSQPLSVDAFEGGLAGYLLERSEEARAVRVGEKEVSEQAAIVERHAGLFTLAQLRSLRGAEERSVGDELERVARLRLTCQAGIAVRELAARQDALENALLAARVDWNGDPLPLRTAQARLATMGSYGERNALGEAVLAVSAGFNDERLDLLAAGESLAAELSGDPDPISRSEAEKGVRLQQVHDAVERARTATTDAYDVARQRWLDELLGPERDEQPTSAHVPWLRRLSPLESTYTREAAVPVCVGTLRALGLDIEAAPGIRLDLDDRPQKSPRACVIASDPPRLVHLITRAQGGLHDYEAFLHEAGHALHYAGCHPGLPYAFRRLSRDHALTEIFSFALDAIVREPGWHAERFGLTDLAAETNAAAARFVNALLFRRYSAKLGFELAFWGRFTDVGGTADGYAERLTPATGIRYPAEGFVADMDDGFYSADYLRAWIRAAQLRDWLRREVGADWWRRPATGDFLRGLFREGTRPSSEDVAARIGFDPLDTGPLEGDLAA